MERCAQQERDLKAQRERLARERIDALKSRGLEALLDDFRNLLDGR